MTFVSGRSSSPVTSLKKIVLVILLQSSFTDVIFASSCVDISASAYCNRWFNYCTLPVMQTNCRKTCGVCADPTSPPSWTLGPDITDGPLGSCGTRKVISHSIVGGTDAAHGDWPWMVRLMNGYWCGGSLISDRYVITAAHCVYPDTDASHYRVRLGERDISLDEGTEVTVGVERIVIHPRYLSNSEDIALLKLDRSVKFTDYIQPICLPNADTPVGANCSATGWGYNNVLNEVVLPVVSNKVCAALNKHNTGSPLVSEVCAGDAGKTPGGACNGDSGGPLACHVGGRWELHGVTSTGPSSCNSAHAYTTFARVRFFRDWIIWGMRRYGH